MLHFENPFAFIFLLVLPIFYALKKTGLFRRHSFSLTISDWGGKTFVYEDKIRKILSVFANFLLISGFIFLTISFSNPVIRHQEKIFTSRGSDILFVLDTSPSMASRDIALVNGSTTRIEASRQGIKSLISSENGSSFGLVAMASEAALIVPPTKDKNFFLNRLDALSVGEFGEGSAIGIGLTTAIYHLVSSAAPKKCIVLITDGENNAGEIHIETAANLANEKGITIYALGIGTKGSVPIEYIDKKSGKIRSGFYESDFNAEPLQKIAGIANGKYFGIENLNELSSSLSEISQNEEETQSFYYRSRDTECYGFFLAIAMLLFFTAFALKRIILSELL